MARLRAWAGLLLCSTACRQQAASHPAVGDSLLAAGQTFYDAEDYGQARSAYAAAVEHAQATDDVAAKARALTGLGLAEYRLATNLDTAAMRESRAIELWHQLGRSQEAGPAYNVLGLIRLDQNRDQDGIAALERAAEAARASGDSITLARALGNLALPYAYRGDFTAGRAAARGLRAAGRIRRDARWEGNGLTNEAMIDLMVADPLVAIARLDTARALYRKAGYQTGEQVALGHLSAGLAMTGDYGSAFAALDTALALARGRSLRYEEAVNLRMIADLHARVGDYRRAVSLYGEAETILRETGATADLAAALRGSAEAYSRLGNSESAMRAAREAFRLDRDNGERSAALEDLVLLAWLEAPGAPRDTIAARLAAIRGLADTVATRGAQGMALLAEARVADRRGDPAGALRAAVALAAVATGDDATLADAWALEARSAARLGRLGPAVAAGRRAVAAIDRLRRTLPAASLAAALVADRAEIYGDLVLTLLRMGRQDEAFAVADGGRSRGLLEHLAGVRSARGAVGELAEGEALLRTIDQLMQRLRTLPAPRPDQRGALPGNDAGDIVRGLAAARAAYEAVTIRAAARDPKATALLGADAGSTLAKVRAALGPREALVEYFIGAKLVTFVVRPQGLAVATREIDPAELVQRVRLLRDLWGTPTPAWRTGLATARALHRDLLAPLEEQGVLDGVDRLVIVPHGILESVPFAALQNDASGRFVAEQYATMRVPSAAALAALGRAGGLEGRGAMVFAPFPDRLPATRQEAQAAGVRLPGATVRLGAEATEPRVRAALESDAFVHFATHGVFNARNPMFSRVELARGGAPAGEGDGRLEVHEILGLAIRSPFVFFSGCETGAFREWTEDPLLGAGETGLAQAVLAAGARDVVATLWRIDDAGAAAFADRFYRRFGSEDAASALASTQRSLATDGRYGSPYYWAGYTLNGLGRTRPQIASAHP